MPHVPTAAAKLLKIAQLAAMLDLSQRTIWRYVAEGKLPEPVRFSRVCVRWKPEEVQEAVDRLKKN
jgi:predicted DNA-binding transcriptional regulator AlpA